MAAGDEFLFEISRRVLLTGLTDPSDIGYRQRVLADCLRRAGHHPPDCTASPSAR